MSFQLRLTQLALVGCFGVAIWGTMGMLFTTGTVAHMKALAESGRPLLPETRVPVKTHYTGIKPIDEQLVVLGIFFWSVLGRDHPEYSLHLNDFAFQFAVQYGLLLIEGSRPGNSGRWIRYASVWFGLAQNFAVANTLPVYFLMYLATSSTVHGANFSTILPSSSALLTLPISLLLGYFLPAFMMGSTVASVFSNPTSLLSSSTNLDVQQNWMAIWQAFPLWTAIFQLILPTLLSPILSSTSDRSSPAEKVNANVELLRTNYAFLKYLSAFGHISSYALSLKTFQDAHWFAPGIPEALDFWKVWVPPSISPAFKVASVGEGAQLFLQYDRIMSCASIVIWAYYMYSQVAVRKDVGVRANVWSVLKTLVTAAAIGPAGAAVALMEARDEVVLKQGGAERKKVI